MAETPPNTPQRARIAAQQHERSNRTLDSPQRHRTPHQGTRQIPALNFNVPLPPPVVVPGDDPFAVPVQNAPVQYQHLPQHLADALRNLPPEPPARGGGRGRGRIPPAPVHQYQNLPQHLADALRNLPPEPPARGRGRGRGRIPPVPVPPAAVPVHQYQHLPQHLAEDYAALPPLQPLQYIQPAHVPLPAPPQPAPPIPPVHIDIQAAMDAA